MPYYYASAVIPANYFAAIDSRSLEPNPYALFVELHSCPARPLRAAADVPHARV